MRSRLDEIRSVSAPDIRAMLVAFAFAPLAVGVVFTLVPVAIVLIAATANEKIERPAGLLMMPIVGWVALTPAAYVFCWVVCLPVAMLLRSRDRLNARAALLPAALVPLGGAAAVTVNVWSTAGGNVPLMFLYLAFLFAPPTFAVGVVFWLIFSHLAGGPPGVPPAHSVRQSQSAPF